MKKERRYSEDEIIQDAFSQYEKLIKAKKKSLANKVFKQCKEGGEKHKGGKKQLKSLSTMEVQLRYLKDTPNAALPYPELDLQETIEAWETGIDNYKHDLESPDVEERIKNLFN